LALSVTEQEFDEAPAHIGAFGVSRARRRRRLLLDLIGVDHRGPRERHGFDRDRLMKSDA
jgi:hypothetical protein